MPLLLHPHPQIRDSCKPGNVVIMLAGKYRGKRAVVVGTTESGLLVVSGPFKINGVPLRRVNQAYVIGTSTTVDVSKVDASKFNDAYFAKAKSAGHKKSEKEFFEGSEKVRCNARNGAESMLAPCPHTIAPAPAPCPSTFRSACRGLCDEEQPQSNAELPMLIKQSFLSLMPHPAADLNARRTRLSPTRPAASPSPIRVTDRHRHACLSTLQKKEIPAARKADQAAVDKAVLGGIKDGLLKKYLGSTFTLKNGQYPHEMIF